MKLMLSISIPGSYPPKRLSIVAIVTTILKKSIKVNEVEIIDISQIYSRVIALQLSHEAMKIENVFKFELAPIPTPSLKIQVH